RPVLHLVLGAEHDRLRGTCLLTGRSLTDRDPVGAERALVGFVISLRDAGNVEGTALHAIAAADAVLLHEVDDAVGVLHDRTRRRARFEAARILAMHAAVLADQPLEIAGARVLVLGVAHQRPAVGSQVMRVVVHPDVDADFLSELVPLEARRLARLAADALRDVDQLGDLGLPLGRRCHRGCRSADQVLFAELGCGLFRGGIGDCWKHVVALPYATGPTMGSTLTRNALYSGVCELASPTGGVSELIGDAFLVSPMKPKLSGSPTVWTGLPSMVSGLSRLVTTALPLTEPRFDQTRTQPPCLMPFSAASCSDISTKNSG